MACAAYLVPLLLLAAPMAVPTVAACSLIGYEPFSRNQWIDDRHVLTPYAGGVGVFDTVTKNFTLGFNALFVTHAVVSPDGDWLVVSYWNGSLDADCSHDVETVDAFHMETRERHPLADVAATAIAPTEDGIAIFGTDEDRVLYFEWGEWETPSYIRFDFPSRPELHADDVRFAALSDDRRWLGVFAAEHIYVIDLAAAKDVLYERPYPVSYHPGVDPFAFSPDGSMMVWGATGEEGALRVLRLGNESVEQVSAHSVNSAGAPQITGSPEWRDVGIVVPMTDRVRLFPDPMKLTQSEDLIVDGAPHGEAAWNHDGTKLFVGGRTSGDPENWTHRYWIVSDGFEEIENHTTATMFLTATASHWEDVPAGNDDPSDDVHHEAPQRSNGIFAAPGASAMLGLALLGLAAARYGLSKKQG